MHRAVDEMAHVDTFRGYGPEQGYSFLVKKIIETNYVWVSFECGCLVIEKEGELYGPAR